MDYLVEPNCTISGGLLHNYVQLEYEHNISFVNITKIHQTVIVDYDGRIY